MNTSPPRTPGELQSRILSEYDGLSKRLKQIARFAIDHPNDMALDTTAVVAKRAGVQPSAVIRFAKAFGFSGFSDMQRVYQVRLAESASSYSERIRRLRAQKHDHGAEPTVHDMLREFCEVNTVSLEHLPEGVPAQRLEAATARLASARTIHLCGLRRSFPVVAYLAYALGRIDCAANLLDGVGGMLAQQAGHLGPEDALLAVTFHPYAPETADLVSRAAERGCPTIVITDTPLSPVASHAEICFDIHDAELYTFRSLTASMCLAQALAVGVGLRLERDLCGH
ncbi:MurR/RpiR family transcriptional regulator [Spiribacter halobius]|uniref:Fe-S cluster assembly protein HesB n=1 Tax=Sediminicurvatus halobius TaxID=2182432 RepID=A0A2U2N7B6_9GAMM|nr:MurR/RpiR family transcriptional regulator [Spiribacter halobius]PWG64987.1 Fe-S cluster assembly protein HesB [Spiribacter halobius]UEX78185.1 MurR/RpiR family transcriptional regulator [Spiribacter halobius]